MLVDDHRLVREGLRALLHDIPQVRVIGEAADGEEALRKLLVLQPDVVLTDIVMPGVGGLALLRTLKSQSRKVKVVLLSMHDHDEYVVEAMRLGADGYVVKNAASEELSTALRTVARGDIYLSPPIAGKLAQNFQVGGSAVLTERQVEVLRGLALGLTSKEIARELGLSPKTVETHRAQIMDRLAIRDLAGLVRYAVRKGLVRAED